MQRCIVHHHDAVGAASTWPPWGRPARRAGCRSGCRARARAFVRIALRDVGMALGRGRRRSKRSFQIHLTSSLGLPMSGTLCALWQAAMQSVQPSARHFAASMTMAQRFAFSPAAAADSDSRAPCSRATDGHSDPQGGNPGDVQELPSASASMHGPPPGSMWQSQQVGLHSHVVVATVAELGPCCCGTSGRCRSGSSRSPSPFLACIGAVSLADHAVAPAVEQLHVVGPHEVGVLHAAASPRAADGRRIQFELRRGDGLALAVPERKRDQDQRRSRSRR